MEVAAKSTPTDVVTDRDRAAERAILTALAASRPGDAVVTEESEDQAGTTDVSWVIDPLDGTVNYLYGLPYYSVSIAARIGGEVVCGVVLDVERDELYAAVRGGGARCGDRPLRCSTQTDPAYALVATGFSYDARMRAEQARVMTSVLPAVRDIRRVGSAALDLCAVAAGRVDAFFEAGMYPWDWSAGALIAREAGARVDGLAGKPPGGHLTLAANPALFDALHELLVAAGGDAPSPSAERLVGPST